MLNEPVLKRGPGVVGKVTWDDDAGSGAKAPSAAPAATPAASSPVLKRGPGVVGPVTWDDDTPAATTAGGAQPESSGRSLGRAVADFGVGLGQGIESAGLAIPQLANTLTGGAIDRYIWKPVTAGVDKLTGGPGIGSTMAESAQDTRNVLEQGKSPTLRRHEQELADTHGFWNSAKKVVTDPYLLTDQVAQQLPQFITPAGAARKAGEVAFERAAGAALKRGIEKRVAAGATEDAARAGATKAAERIGRRAAHKAGERAVMASAGAIGAGQSSEQAQQSVMALPQATLDQSEDYQKLISSGMSPGAAREHMAEMAGLKAAAIAGPLDIATSGLTARLESGIFQGDTGVQGLRNVLTRKGLAAVGKATAKETAEEAGQEGGEQFAQNVGVRGADPNQGLLDQVPEQAAIGGAVGGLIGGGMFAGSTALGRGAPTVQDHPAALQRPDVPYPDAAPGSLSDAANVMTATGGAAQHAQNTAAANAASEQDAAATLQRQPAQAEDRNAPPRHPVNADDLVARAKRRLAVLDTAAYGNQTTPARELTPQEHGERAFLQENANDPKALAKRLGVDLESAPRPQPKPTNRPDEPKPRAADPISAPWIDTATGEVAAPSKEDITLQMAHQMLAQHAQDGSLRVNLSDLSDAWGVSATALKKARKGAERMASESLTQGTTLPDPARSTEQAQADLTAEAAASDKRFDAADARAKAAQDGLRSTRQALQGRKKAQDAPADATANTTPAPTAPAALQSAEQVDQAVADGFTQLASTQAGDTKRYSLVHPDGRRVALPAAQYLHAKEAIGERNNDSQASTEAAQEAPVHQPQAVPDDASTAQAGAEQDAGAHAQAAVAGVPAGVSGADQSADQQPALTAAQSAPAGAKDTQATGTTAERQASEKGPPNTAESDVAARVRYARRIAKDSRNWGDGVAQMLSGRFADARPVLRILREAAKDYPPAEKAKLTRLIKKHTRTDADGAVYADSDFQRLASEYFAYSGDDVMRALDRAAAGTESNTDGSQRVNTPTAAKTGSKTPAAQTGNSAAPAVADVETAAQDGGTPGTESTAIPDLAEKAKASDSGAKVERAHITPAEAASEDAKIASTKPVSVKTPGASKKSRPAEANSSETPNGSFRIEAKGPKGIIVHGDVDAARAALKKAGFKKSGRVLKAGGLRFDAKDRAKIEAALSEPTPRAAKSRADEKPIVDLGEKIGGARKDTAVSRPGKARASTPKYDVKPTRQGDGYRVVDHVTGRPVGGRNRYASQTFATQKEAQTYADELNRSTAEAKSSESTWRKRYAVVENTIKTGGAKPWFAVDTRTGRSIPGGGFDSEADAEAALKMYEVSRKHRVFSTRVDGKDVYNIWRQVSDRKRVRVVKQDFDSREAALEYMASHADAIINAKTRFGEEVLAKPDNVTRQGPERRKGDVKGDDFLGTFGFRGVEFGNWNNQHERQVVMNHAYDGLMDLAELLGLPPRAMSLNGDLALAFGARGQGLTGARAHYERSKGVINLTKLKGSGALAHEWFHALDSYLARVAGLADADLTMDKSGTRSFKKSKMLSEYRPRANGPMRAELAQAYHTLVNTMFRKAERYVADTEQAAAFVERTHKALADQLQGVRHSLMMGPEQLSFKKRFNQAATKDQLEAFDKAAKALMDGPPALKPYMNEKGPRTPRSSNEPLEAISAIYKKVRGRSGFTASRDGLLNRVAGAIQTHAQRVRMLESARNSDTRERQVPTRYAMDAKSIDQGQVKNYWTTAPEMAARAFSAYVEDKLKASGHNSDFLSFGSSNDMPAYRLLGIRPFPEGQERKALDAAFNTFFDTVKTVEHESGNVALFSRAEPGAVRGRLGTQQVQKIARGILRVDPDQANVAVVASFSALPDRVHRAVVAQGVHDGEINALHWRGKSWILADMMRDPAHVAETIFHEHYTHGGLRAKYGRELGPKLDTLVKGLGGLDGVLKMAAKQDVDLSEYQRAVDANPHMSDATRQRVLMEELLAHMSALTGTLKRTAQEWLGAVRAFLRRHGFADLATYNASDLAHVLRQAREAAQGSRARASDGSQTQGFRFTAAKAPARTSAGDIKHLKRVNATAREATGAWGDNQPRVRVLHSAEMLPRSAKIDPRYKRALGFYDGRTVYLVAPNLRTRAAVLKTLTHEAVGHYGVDRIVNDALGAEGWDTIVQSIAQLRANGRGGKAMQAVLDEVGRRYGEDADAVTFAKETLAVMAEKGVRNSLMDRVTRALRAFVRRIMPSLNASPAELRQLLVRSDAYLRSSETYAQRVARVQSMAFGHADPVTSAAFKRWFGHSKVTNKAGAPQVVYHGTGEDFTVFDDRQTGSATGHATSPLGYFFTPNKALAQRYAENASDGVPAEQRVVDAYVAIAKPYTMTLDEAQAIESQDQARALRARLEREGYDGIHMTEPDTWIAFRPGQVKSASENTGAYDASNPDIRFSLSKATKQRYDDRIDALFRGSKPKYNGVRILDRSDILGLLGYGDKPLNLVESSVGKKDRGKKDRESRKHAMTAADWKKVPEWIERPAAAFRSQTRPNRVVLFAPDLVNGRPVRIILQPNGEMGGTDVHVAVNAYEEGGTHVTPVDKWVKHGDLLYLDQKRSPALAERSGLRLPGEVRQLRGYKQRVLTERDLVNYNAESEGPKHQPVQTPKLGEDAAGLAKNRLLNGRDSVKDPPSGGKGNFSLPDASVDTMNAVIQQPDESAFKRVQGWLSGKWEDLKPKTLGALQLRHVLELAEEHPALKGAKLYADLNQRMDADRNQLMVGSPDAGDNPDRMLLKGVAPIAEMWRTWAHEKGVGGMLGRKKPEAKALADLMHDATIYGLDPAEEYTRLTMENARGELMDWTPKLVKERIKAIRGQMRSRPGDEKDMMLGEIKRLRGLGAREHMREQRWPELVKRFHALPKEAQQIYRETRDWYTEHADATEMALLDRIDAMDVPETYRRSLKDRIRFQFEANRKEGVYFPLNRDGDYWLSVTDDKGEQGFKMFESARELKQAERKLRAAGFTIDAHGRRDGDYKASQAPDGTFVKDVIQLMKKAGSSEQLQDDVYQMFLKSLPEMSMRKRHIHRRAVPGFSDDALRAFAKNGFHGSHQLARLRYGQRMQSVIEAMQDSLDNYRRSGELDESTKAEGLSAAKGDALLGELKKRNEWIMAPKDSKLANMATSVGFLYYLGASPASALVNLTQGAQVTLPALAAAHGWGKASRMLGAATRDALRTGGNIIRTLNEEEQRAYRVLERRGDIDRTNAHTLAGVAEGNVLTSNPAWSKVMNVMSWMFHKAEVVNREAAGIASYRLARAAGKDFNTAVQYASDIINGTHFDYSNSNRPRFMQSGTSKVLLQFKNYSVGMTWMMYRNLYQAVKGESPEVRRLARRTLTGMMGMTALLSGVVGLPLINLIKLVANGAHAAWGDDDKPWDFMTEFRSWLAEHFGETGAHFIADGAVDQLGLNISSRVSLSDLWFRDADRQLEGRDAYYNLLDAVAGPMGGMAKNWFVGQQEIGQGHVWRGVERMMPTFAKNGMKSFRYATQGVNTLRGDPIMEDPSTADSLFQALGFRPTSLAEQQRINSAMYNYSDQIKNRRHTLMNAFAMAVHQSDTDARRVALTKVRKFNSTYPNIAITTDTLLRSLSQRARLSQRAEHGVILSRRIKQQVRQDVGAAAGHP